MDEKIEVLNFPIKNTMLKDLDFQFIEKIKQQNNNQNYYYLNKQREKESIVISNRKKTISIEKVITSGLFAISFFDETFSLNYQIKIELDVKRANTYNFRFFKDIFSYNIKDSNLKNILFKIEDKTVLLNEDGELILDNNYIIRKKMNSYIISFLEDSVVKKIMLTENNEILIEIRSKYKEFLNVDDSNIIVDNNYQEFLNRYQDILLLFADQKLPDLKEFEKITKIINKIDNKKDEIIEIEKDIKNLNFELDKIILQIKTSNTSYYIESLLDSLVKKDNLLDNNFCEKIDILSKRVFDFYDERENENNYKKNMSIENGR